MRVLVVGGTGVLGAPAADALHRAGHHLRMLVRTPGTPVTRDRCELAIGDLDDAASVERAMDGCDAVHVSVRGGPGDEAYDRVEHLGTARVARLAARAGLSRLTYVSHMLAAPDVPAADLRAKSAAEEAIATSGVPYTIFRPSYVTDTLPRQVRGARAVVLGRQPHPFHMVTAADLGALVVRALQTPESAGQRFTVHGPEPVTIAAALRIYCRHRAPTARVVTMPIPVMRLLDRTLLHGELRGTLALMRVLQRTGEQGDPVPTNALLGAPTTTVERWCAQQRR